MEGSKMKENIEKVCLVISAMGLIIGSLCCIKVNLLVVFYGLQVHWLVLWVMEFESLRRNNYRYGRTFDLLNGMML